MLKYNKVTCCFDKFNVCLDYSLPTTVLHSYEPCYHTKDNVLNNNILFQGPCVPTEPEQYQPIVLRGKSLLSSFCTNLYETRDYLVYTYRRTLSPLNTHKIF